MDFIAILFVAWVLSIGGDSHAFASTDKGPAFTKSTLPFHQSPQTTEIRPQSFEVASVRLCPPGDNRAPFISPVGTTSFTATRISLQLLVGIAFGTPSNHILGAPSWFESQLYDVNAKLAGDKSLTARDRQKLLQQLLQERFHLAVHREVKGYKGYALIIAKNEPKLRPSGVPGQGVLLRGRLHFPNETLEDFARILERVTGQPVVNETNIGGKFDIELDYAPIDDASSSLPSIFTVVQEELGLKLIPREVPVEELVIDHVDKSPTQN